MRDIWHINIHCSDSDYDYHDNVESIYQWHVVEKGWSDIGYNFIILQNGDIKECRPLTRMPASVKGHNKGGIGIMLTGRYNFSTAQFKSLRKLVQRLQSEFNISNDLVKGHNQYKGHFNRGCPNFDVQQVLYGYKGVKQWK